ncbi:hypothetical protein [Terrabacter sp. 2YAF2]|uniref:hypothetical protein n=1 Tax=Terrabacter sp. 2YAF2 TaxID=3233026 RepID=UPI003F95785A
MKGVPDPQIPGKNRAIDANDTAFLEALRAKADSTSDHEIVLQYLNEASPDELKAALTQASPAQKHLLFSGVPADQIASVLATTPSRVLAPATPPPPAPAPTGGPPASIMETTFENVQYPPAENDPDWAQKISGGSTIGITSPPPWEWVSVYDQTFEKEGSLNNPVVGLTGWVVNPQISGADVWFVHPFDNDFEFYIAPDPQFQSLLSASNTGVNPSTGNIDADFHNANSQAHAIGLEVPTGVLGVETDQRLLPESFRNIVKTGSRIAAFGRWIVDCGHDDFHTEIHAPLLMAVATPGPAPAGVKAVSQMTSVQIISRPYTVSQKWPEGNFIDHLLAEVAKVETTFFGVPFSWRVEAHPTIFTTPYDGRPFIKLLVQTPPRTHHPGPLAQPALLKVNFHFTHRARVAVQVFNAGNDTVGIAIVLGDLNPATLPPKHDRTIQWSELGDTYSYVIDALQIADILTLDIASAVVLNRGILTDIYDAPSATSPLDNENIAQPVQIDELPAGAGLSEDDTQPFPIYGWLNVWWEEPPVVAKP